MFLILTQNNKSTSSKRFTEEAKKMNLTVRLENPFNHSLLFDPSQIRLPQWPSLQEKAVSSFFGLHRCTGTNFDDFDFIFSESLIRLGARVENSPPSMKKLRGKDNQLLFFSEHNLPHIPTICLRGRPQEGHLKELESYFGHFQSKEKYVLKTTRGNRGLGVNLINGRDSLFSILETFWAMQDQRFILQPFIESFEEYRIFIIKNKLLGAIKKTGPSFDFRKNYERAQAFNFLKPESLMLEIRELAELAIKKSGCLYLALDILLTKDGPLIIEMNTVPGLENFEKISGINVAKETILSLINE